MKYQFQKISRDLLIQTQFKRFRDSQDNHMYNFSWLYLSINWNTEILKSNSSSLFINWKLKFFGSKFGKLLTSNFNHFVFYSFDIISEEKLLLIQKKIGFIVITNIPASCSVYWPSQDFPQKLVSAEPIHEKILNLKEFFNIKIYASNPNSSHVYRDI